MKPEFMCVCSYKASYLGFISHFFMSCVTQLSSDQCKENRIVNSLLFACSHSHIFYHRPTFLQTCLHGFLLIRLHYTINFYKYQINVSCWLILPLLRLTVNCILWPCSICTNRHVSYIWKLNSVKNSGRRCHFKSNMLYFFFVFPTAADFGSLRLSLWFKNRQAKLKGE